MQTAVLWEAINYDLRYQIHIDSPEMATFHSSLSRRLNFTATTRRHLIPLHILTNFKDQTPCFGHKFDQSKQCFEVLFDDLKTSSYVLRHMTRGLRWEASSISFKLRHLSSRIPLYKISSSGAAVSCGCDSSQNTKDERTLLFIRKGRGPDT
jgi:hypothetical protein